MNFNWLLIYIVPMTASVLALMTSILVGKVARSRGRIETVSSLWHCLIWVLLLSHIIPRLYLLTADFNLALALIGLELMVTLLVAGGWHVLGKKYLRTEAVEFYEADMLLKWTDLCGDILPKKSIPIFKSGKQIPPHTRGCENPVFCVSQDLLETLSDTGQRYIMAHFLYHIKCRHHQYKRLFNFAFVLMWYNPLLHLVHMLLHRDFNEVSDQLTLAHFGKNHAGSYGMTLIHTYDLHGPKHPILAMAYRRLGNNHLKVRIARLSCQ